VPQHTYKVQTARNAHTETNRLYKPYFCFSLVFFIPAFFATNQQMSTQDNGF